MDNDGKYIRKDSSDWIPITAMPNNFPPSGQESVVIHYIEKDNNNG